MEKKQSEKKLEKSKTIRPQDNSKALLKSKTLVT